MKLYVFSWRNNPKRAELFGRVCRILCRGTLNSRMVEFIDSGQREIISGNALRRIT